MNFVYFCGSNWMGRCIIQVLEQLNSSVVFFFGGSRFRLPHTPLPLLSASYHYWVETSILTHFFVSNISIRTMYAENGYHCNRHGDTSNILLNWISHELCSLELLVFECVEEPMHQLFPEELFLFSNFCNTKSKAGERQGELVQFTRAWRAAHSPRAQPSLVGLNRSGQRQQPGATHLGGSTDQSANSHWVRCPLNEIIQSPFEAFDASGYHFHFHCWNVPVDKRSL